MSLGHIERDIRLLEDVVACQITPTEVIVLVKPGADPDAVGAAVMGILVGAAADRSLKVLGGTPAAAAVVPFRRRAGVIAGTAGAAVLAAATVAAAVSGVFDSEPSPHQPEIAVGPPTTSVRPRPPVQGSGLALSPGFAQSPVTTPGTEATATPLLPGPGGRRLPVPRVTVPTVAPATPAPAAPAPAAPSPAAPSPAAPSPAPAPSGPTPPPDDDGYPLQPPVVSTPAATPVVIRVPLPPVLVDTTPVAPAPRQLATAPECAAAPPWGPKALGRGPAGHGRWADADEDCDAGRLARWRNRGKKNVGGGEEDTR